MSLPRPAVPEIFPDAWEIMATWKDPRTQEHKTWVRFFAVDSKGDQVGPDLFDRFFDSTDLLVFMCSRSLRSALALEPRKPQEDLTHEERDLIAEILRAKTATKTPSFLQRVRAYLLMIRRKAGGLDRRAVSPVKLSDFGVISMKGNR